MAHQIWKTSCDQLRTKIDPQTYTTWIEPIYAAHFHNGTLSLSVPTRFMANWIEKHFFGLISDTVRQVEPGCERIAIVADGAAGDTDATAGPFLTPRDGSATAPTEEESTPLPQRAFRARAANEPRAKGNLNAKNTFDTFIIGPSNNFAYAAARAVAKSPGSTYNPLFVYGGVGLGKTHLMQAIGHEVFGRNSSATVLYMTSEEFTNELIAAIQNRSTAAFRAKYRSVDVLLIDDIHFIAGRESTQEEFFHTFNTLYDAGRQIVLSSDRPPKEIHELEERLVSRFQWGLVTDIQPPDVETRMAILRAKAEHDNVELPQEVAHFIAQTITTNIRELEGALIRVTAFASMLGKRLTLEVAQQALEPLVPNVGPTKPLSVDRIQQLVAGHYDVRIADLKSAKRSRQFVQPRQVAMYLCRELTSASLIDIGDAFGGRDHTTVMHSCRKVAEELSTDIMTRQTIEMLTGRLREDG